MEQEIRSKIETAVRNKIMAANGSDLSMLGDSEIRRVAESLLDGLITGITDAVMVEVEAASKPKLPQPKTLGLAVEIERGRNLFNALPIVSKERGSDHPYGNVLIRSNFDRLKVYAATLDPRTQARIQCVPVESSVADGTMRCWILPEHA